MVKKTKSNEKSNTINNESEKDNNLNQKSKIRVSKPLIAGIILILVGLLFVYVYIPFLTIDDETINDLKENNEGFREQAKNLTNKEIKKQLFNTGIIGLIISSFLILGGIFAIIKKGWFISLIGGIVGIIFSGFTIITILPLLAFVLIVFSKKEFQKIKKQEMDNKTG